MPTMWSRYAKPIDQTFFLFGPRGTGKSTWLHQHFPHARFYDLLRADEYLRLSKSPELLRADLSALPKHSWVVIDEVQKVPTLLDEVHTLIESQKLRFVLSGSSARKLKRGGANLLAGRARVLNLFPLVSAEIPHALDADRVLSFGLLPMAVTGTDPADYLRAYGETYLKEEVAAEALTRNLGGFARFLEIAARQNGQITNVTNIARDAQVARQTVQGYFEILRDTLLGDFLSAWQLKRSTHQVAHPKFYFCDAGITRALSGRLPYPMQAEERGTLLETWIWHELRAYLSYTGKHYPLHFWSSRDGVEVDFFFETQTGYCAIEVKSASEWQSKYQRGLLRLREELGEKHVQLWGVYLGEHVQHHGAVTVLPVREFLHHLWQGKME